MALRSVHRLQHLLGADAQPLGDVIDGGSAPQSREQLGEGLFDLEDPLLNLARHVDRPATVAEMALQLPEDGGDGEGREGGAALGVEAVDRLDQSDARDLDQIVEWLNAPE